MSLRAFLHDKWLFCVLQGMLISFVGMMLSVFRVGTYGVLFVVSLMLGVNGLLLVSEYMKKAFYYKHLEELLTHLDKKFLASEVIKRPKGCIERVWWEILKDANKDMNDEVAYYRRLQEDYKEYIEVWIHEIKTPLACINLMCDNEASDFARRLRNELDKVEGFVEQALFYARSTSLEKDYLIKEVDLEELVRGAIRKEARQLIEAKVKIELGNVAFKVYTDGKWIDFMLGQLIGNSVKYRKGVLCLSFEACEEKGQVRLKICDNGMGIPVEDCGRVFDKGFTGVNGRRFAKSTGLGLYMCKQLCEKMHMGIHLESEVGSGTTVTLIFPKDKGIFLQDS